MASQASAEVNAIGVHVYIDLVSHFTSGNQHFFLRKLVEVH